MTAQRVVSLHGLGFGDCGKGLVTDCLTQRLEAHTVVRFNGGAQAGHNVVLADGRHHTFSQFGAGSFNDSVVTVLAAPVVVHPTALLVEAQVLQGKGVADALARLRIDARCRLTTLFHQAAGRLREWRRGSQPHGSCGAGFGETVRQALQRPAETLRFADLADPRLAMQKLEATRQALAAEFADLDARQLDAAHAIELACLHDATLSRRWFERAGELLHAVPLRREPPLAERLQRNGTVIFEGAQGVLLDEWRGFHPHTTWSSTGVDAVEALLAECAPSPSRLEREHYGVSRSYLTRHGAGPLPTEDAALDAITEPHNGSDGWQGAFRRGHADAVLLAYAAELIGRLDGVFLTHLDALQATVPLRWCRAYEDGRDAEAGADAEAALVRNGAGEIVRLRPGRIGDLDHQRALTRALSSAVPLFDGNAIAAADELIERVEAAAQCRVVATSAGPTRRDLRERHGLLPGA